MKKNSALVVGIVILTCFLFYVPSANAQTGPVAGIELWQDSTNTLIDFDSVFSATAEWFDTPPHSLPDGFKVFNYGDEPLVYTIAISNSDFTGDFNTSFTILPGDEYGNDHEIIFAPSHTGIANGVVTITTNDPHQEEIEFNVKGYGLESPVDNGSMQFNLVIGETFTQEMVVRNTTPNRAKFRIQPEFVHALNLVVSKDNDVLALNDDFVLESGDSAVIDLYFEYEEISLPGEEDVAIPLKITYEPFHDRNFRTLYVYKYIYVDGIFPLATIIPSDFIHTEVPVSTVDSIWFELQNYGNTELNYVFDSDSLLSEMTGGVRLLSTGFEELTPGIAQRQSGWSELSYVFYIENNHDWTVETVNPFIGSKHLRCTSNDANFGAEFFAPESGGNATIIDMMVNLDSGSGSQWEFRALDETYSTKKFIVGSNGSLSVLNEPSSYQIEPISSPLPKGYFNLRLSLNTITKEFTISIEGLIVYTGFSNATKFIKFSMGKDEQVAGSIMDVDNFRWIDGSENIRLLSVEPELGSVPPMSVEQIKLRIDTRNIDAGTYSEIFTIRSNDPVKPVVFMPVTIVVKPNELPVLIGDFNVTMFSGETKSFIFSATDADDSLVSVSDHYFEGSGSHGEPAGYISSETTASGNKFLRYTITTDTSPYMGYVKGTIQANDARGGIVTKLLYVTILPFRENDFILTNFKNGNVVANFTDTVTLDVAHPDIDRLTIRANFPPEITGEGMMFTLGGVEINRDLTQPYYLSPGVLPKLSEGYHTLLASSYYQYSENDLYIIDTRQTLIHVINSAAVTNYEVVTRDGVKIMDLTNGSVIDLSQIGTTEFNIIAKTNMSSVRSVKFALNNITARIDNGAPFAFAGNVLGDTYWKPKAGQYRLTATPFLKYYGWGVKGVSLTVSFKVINGTSKATTTIARTETSIETQVAEGTLDPGNALSVYPVPAADQLYIELHESVKGNVVLHIMNAQGQSVHLKAGLAEDFNRYSVSTAQLGISQGIYFVIVNQSNGKRLIKKFVKE